MKQWETTFKTEKETEKLAKRLGEYLEGGEVITLAGELGTGKTTFTKGLALGLEIKRAVTSPTFTIMKQYNGRLPLNHVDAYRLEHAEDDIGLDDYLYSEGVTVIEWAVFIEEYLPKERLAIELTFINETTRKFTFTAQGTHYENLLEKLKT